MALVYTPEPELGQTCPDFELPAVDGKTYSLKDFKGHKALLVMFICNHCPYVKAIEDRLILLGDQTRSKGVAIVAICANDAERYPEDSFENLKNRWEEKNYSFPYLYDEDQQVAKTFGAVCTPDFFLYDENLSLAYRGRLDDSWKAPENVTKEELKAAIECLVSGKKPCAEQTPSMGCSIKWKE